MVLGFVFVWLLWPFPFPKPRSLLGAKNPPQQSLIPNLHGRLTCKTCVKFFGRLSFVLTNLFWSLTGPGVRDLWPSSNWKALLKALSVKKMAFGLKKNYLFSGCKIFFEMSCHYNFDANKHIQCKKTCNSPKNRNLSADSPNLLSLKAFGLSRTRSLLAFLVFLLGGDRLRFSLPATDLAWIWKLFSPCSKPSNLGKEKV